MPALKSMSAPKFMPAFKFMPAPKSMLALKMICHSERAQRVEESAVAYPKRVPVQNAHRRSLHCACLRQAAVGMTRCLSRKGFHPETGHSERPAGVAYLGRTSRTGKIQRISAASTARSPSGLFVAARLSRTLYFLGRTQEKVTCGDFWEGCTDASPFALAKGEALAVLRPSS